MVSSWHEIVSSAEKIGGRSRLERQMQGFRDALDYCELFDLGFSSPLFTWWDSETKLRLNRVVATATWSDLFNYSRVSNLPPSVSDHVPILLEIASAPLFPRKKKYRFKF